MSLKGKNLKKHSKPKVIVGIALAISVIGGLSGCHTETSDSEKNTSESQPAPEVESAKTLVEIDFGARGAEIICLETDAFLFIERARAGGISVERYPERDLDCKKLVEKGNDES